MKKKILKFVLTGLMIGSIVLSGCGAKKNENTVKIAYFPNITHSQALVLKNKGMVEEKLGEEMKVEWKSFNAGPAEIEALFAGEVDLGYIGPIPAINAYIKSKGDIRILAGATNSGAVLVGRKDAGINSVADLDGKTVSIPQLGNTQHVSLLNLLTENGLRPKSEGGTVEVIAASNADVMNLMERGNIDAALVPEPWGSILEKDAQAELILEHHEVWRNGDYATAVVIVNGDFLKEHPDIVEKFVGAHQEATLYINENKEEAKEIVNDEISKETKKVFAKEILDSAFERLIITDQISKDSIREFAEINMEQGIIETVPAEDIFEDSFLLH